MIDLRWGGEGERINVIWKIKINKVLRLDWGRIEPPYCQPHPGPPNIEQALLPLLLPFIVHQIRKLKIYILHIKKEKKGNRTVPM